MSLVNLELGQVLPEQVFRVTREEITLSGSGRILPGRQNLEPVRYRVGPSTP